MPHRPRVRTLPWLLIIYAKYYGRRMAAFLGVAFYVTMAAAGYVVELLFTPLHLVPTGRHALIRDSGIAWNYTTYLNIVFVLLAAALVWRFYRTGGREMLSMMGGGRDDMDHTDHQHAH